MRKEVFDQPRPWTEHGAEPTQNPVDLEQLRQEFSEKFTKSLCARRTFINNPDGSRTMIETYHIHIEPVLKVDNDYLIEFMHTAAVLGYRSTIGPLFLPDMNSLFKPVVGVEPAVIVVLEQTI